MPTALLLAELGDPLTLDPSVITVCLVFALPCAAWAAWAPRNLSWLPLLPAIGCAWLAGASPELNNLALALPLLACFAPLVARWCRGTPPAPVSPRVTSRLIRRRITEV